MASSPPHSLISVSLLYLTLFISIRSTSVHSFSVDLIHRDDTPSSPLYNPSATRFDRLSKAFRHLSPSHFKISPDDIQSEIFSSGGTYLMKVSIGTPPVPVLATADTGSDLAWTQCKPCQQCFTPVSPLFDPNKSSTFRKLSCNADACTAESTSTSCSATGNTCQYQVTYGDRSYSNGDLVSETFTFGSTSGRTIEIPKTFFGCGHNSNGTFNGTSSGIIGLGRGALSIIQQLSGTVKGKFSYCLVPMGSGANVTSKMSFGETAVVSGPGVVSTPLITKSADNFYYLTLESISVGGNSVAFKNPSSKTSRSSSSSFDGTGQEGNIIIDSGTTFTIVPPEFYENLEPELKQAIKGEPTTDPQGTFGLCYSVSDQIEFPTLTVKFTGAEFKLSGGSTFLRISDDLICFTMVTSNDLAIYGNLWQMNYLVGYDLEKEEISFQPTDCTKHQ